MTWRWPTVAETCRHQHIKVGYKTAVLWRTPTPSLIAHNTTGTMHLKIIQVFVFKVFKAQLRLCNSYELCIFFPSKSTGWWTQPSFTWKYFNLQYNTEMYFSHKLMKIHEWKFRKAQTISSNIVLECDVSCHTSLHEEEHCNLEKLPGFTDFLVCAYSTVSCRDFAVEYRRMCYLLLSSSL